MEKAIDQMRGRHAVKTRMLLASSALALVFVVSPAGLDLGVGGLSLTAQMAQAKNDEDHGNAGGNGGGNDHAATAAEHGNGGGADHGNAGGKNVGVNNSADKGKPSVTGLDKKDEHGGGGVAYTFSKKEADLLLSKGWSANTHENHGAMVSTYVHVAKELGFSARDGALQANFMPADWYAKQAELRGIDTQLLALQEQLATLDEDLAAAELALDDANALLVAANALPDLDPTKAAAIEAANAAIAAAQSALDALPTAEELQAQIDALEGQTDGLKDDLDALAATVPDWKPGNGPQGDEWATVNLDWNGDGVVNQQDVDDKNAGLPQAEVYVPPL